MLQKLHFTTHKICINITLIYRLSQLLMLNFHIETENEPDGLTIWLNERIKSIILKNENKNSCCVLINCLEIHLAFPSLP